MEAPRGDARRFERSAGIKSIPAKLEMACSASRRDRACVKLNRNRSKWQKHPHSPRTQGKPEAPENHEHPFPNLILKNILHPPPLRSLRLCVRHSPPQLILVPFCHARSERPPCPAARCAPSPFAFFAPLRETFSSPTSLILVPFWPDATRQAISLSRHHKPDPQTPKFLQQTPPLINP
jgi:hypothetical protein